MGWMDIKHLFHGNIQNSFFPFNRSHRRYPESCLGRVFNFKFGPICCAVSSWRSCNHCSLVLSIKVFPSDQINLLYLTLLDLTWLDLTWLDLTWLDLTWLDLTWLDLTWLDLTWLDLTWICLTSLDSFESAWLHLTAYPEVGALSFRLKREQKKELSLGHSVIETKDFDSIKDQVSVL